MTTEERLEQILTELDNTFPLGLKIPLNAFEPIRSALKAAYNMGLDDAAEIAAIDYDFTAACSCQLNKDDILKLKL